MEKKKYFEELNIFRALIIIWVTIGHSFTPDQPILGAFHYYAYSFHMCAFFVLSGFLFTSKLSRISSVKDSAFALLDRAKRLLVPYFFFTVVSYVLKMFFESYANNELSSNIIVDTLLCQNNPNGGLWFLYTLFLVSAIFIILNKINKYVLFGISTVLMVVVLIIDVEFMPLYYIMNYAFYFSLGIIIKDFYENIRNATEKLIQNKPVLFGFLTLAMLLISVSITYIQTKIVDNDFFLMLVFAINIATWYLIAFAITKSSIINKPFKVVGEYGMDIYMIGYYVQTVIRVILMSMLGVPCSICSILMCILGIIAPIPLSKYIVRKIPIARALMLGDFKKKVKNNG